MMTSEEMGKNESKKEGGKEEPGDMSARMKGKKAPPFASKKAAKRRGSY